VQPLGGSSDVQLLGDGDEVTEIAQVHVHNEGLSQQVFTAKARREEVGDVNTHPLPTRRLGDLTVPAIGFGAMVLSQGMYGDVDDDRGLAALRHALDAGATFVDTSEAYAAGHNETLVGRAISGRRDEVVVATKFGLNIPDGVERHAFPVAYAFGELTVNADPAQVRGYAESSLRRLRTEVIDLYYLHFPDPQVPIEDTAGAVAGLIGDGLVRSFGLSNVSADGLRRAHAVHPVAAVQVEWSMWKPIPPDLLAAADDLGVGIVAWSPLGGGFLTGTVTGLADSDFRQNAPPVPGRQPRRQQRPLRRSPAARGQPRRDPRPARARLAAPPAPGRRADPGQPHPRPHRREPRCGPR
jgi:aryl-alcohol dehydrogenase-like predicted oxidoreductase